MACGDCDQTQLDAIEAEICDLQEQIEACCGAMDTREANRIQTRVLTLQSQLLLCVAAGSGGGGGGDVNLTQVGGDAVALGQGLMAASLPVVLASDQSNVPANIEQIGGGALALGQALMAGSIPVVLASNQSALSAAITVGTGATDLAKAEDAASASGDVGIATLLKRTDTATAQTGTDGDYTFGVANSFGAQFIDLNTDYRVSATKSPMKVGGAAYTATDSGMASQLWRNTGLSAAATLNTYNNAACGTFAQALSTLVHDTNVSAVSQISKLEDTAHASGDAGVPVWGVRNNSAATTLTSTDGDYSPISVDGRGRLFVNGAQIEDTTPLDQDFGMYVLGVRNNDTATTLTAANGNYSTFAVDNAGRIFVDPACRRTFTTTQPTFTNATSFTLLAANTSRRYFSIQNNGNTNIMFSLSGATLTGIVPTSTNIGLVLPPGGFYESPPNAVPTSAITGYQTSGGSINTVTIVEA